MRVFWQNGVMALYIQEASFEERDNGITGLGKALVEYRGMVGTNDEVCTISYERSGFYRGWT